MGLVGHHHHHNHSHDGHDHGDHKNNAAAASALRWALFLNLVFLIAEIVGGLWTGSLALLSDAAHMFSDVASLGLSLFALWISRKATTPTKTFGYYRAEVLAAFINCLTLWLTMAWIFYEAVDRLRNPTEIHSLGMLGVACAGLAANLLSLFALHRHRDHDMNFRSSYLHLVGDSLGSVAVLVSALVIQFTGYRIADPIASFVIGGITLYSSWGLMRDSIDILMESTPKGIDAELVRKSISQVSGVRSVHDLHIWSLGTHRMALSAHVTTHNMAAQKELIAAINDRLHDDFHITHTTIQVEEDDPTSLEGCFDCGKPENS